MAYTTINKGSSYFNTVLYTGTQTQQTINVGFQPDFVWIKSRSNVQVHALFDAVRGTSIGALQSNSTAAENANQKLVAYTSTGFTLPSVNYEWTNTSGWTFASWNWLGANTTVSNTSGSITSTVSANTTAGFSVVGYTATSGVSSIGHGLGVAPSMIILKTRGQTGNWVTGLAVNGWNKYLTLDTTSANTTDRRMFSPTAGTDPTSTLFWSDQAAIGSAGTMIAYCFAEIKGYSKFGSYTGNGSADGTFIYTGFKPAFIITKASSTTGNWKTSWNSFSNGNDYNLMPNSDAAETTGSNQIDLLSNGFKCRASDTDRNGSGTTYIYMAFAENPFVTSGGIPVTAR